MYYTYILHNKTIDKYYTGYTSDLNKRVLEHNKKIHLSKFTRKQPGIWLLVYFEVFSSKSEAMARERGIKSKKSRKYIEQLINSSLQKHNLGSMV